MATFPARHINCRKSKALRPILEGWLRILHRYIAYCEAQGQLDLPWWYNERATLSTLAAAAWRSGHIALEEFAVTKGRRENQYAGRCDLAIDVNGESFAIEAKQAWCGIGTQAENGFERAETVLGEAVGCARQLTSDLGRRFGLCFAVPHLPLSDQDDVEELLRPWLRQVRFELEYDLMAWYFPQKGRRLRADNDRLYPGVILIAREIFRGK